MQKVKIILKRVILLLVSIFFLSNFSFAATSIGNGNALSLVDPIINLINFVWIPLVMIAGKLYTNGLVYGSDLHLDIILWNIWNFSKTIANFAIGFILVGAIFGLFIGKTKNIFSILGKITIATILINTSWFLIGVLIDISTVLLVSVGSFPMHIIGTTSMQAQVKMHYCKNIEIKYNPNMLKDKKIGDIFSCAGKTDKDKYVEKSPSDFFKHMNNISGPLFFIGASILNIDKSIGINKKMVNVKKNGVSVVAFSTMIYLVTLVLFIVPIILLIIIGIVRLFWIWIYVAFSPLIFLDQVFGGKLSSKNKALTSFKFSNMIGLVFIPVTVTFAMGIAVIFLSTLKTAFVSGATDPAKKSLGIKNNTIEIDGKTMVTIKGNLMNKATDEVGGFFGRLILIIMSSILLWSMLRLVFKSSEITSSISEGIYKFADQSLKTVPILPIGKQGTSIGALQMGLDRGIARTGFNSRASNQAGALLGKIRKNLHLESGDILATEVTTWENKIKPKGDTLKLVFPVLGNFIQDVKKNHPTLIPMQSPNFQEVIAYAINQVGYKHKGIYTELGLIDSKGNPITNSSEMFKQKQEKFNRFVVGMIQETDKFENYVSKGYDITKLCSSSIVSNASASFLAKSLKDISENDN